MPAGLNAARPGAARGRAGGMTDWLPGAAEVRRAASDAVLDTFAAWGYGLVSTPLVEPLDTVVSGVGRSAAQLFRFMDRDGALLALVGERTVSVARVVATQMRDAPRPLRLSYAGPVLNNRALLGGRRREAMQAGCELIGAAGLAADAECVALAADALNRVGLTDAQIDVGHADFLPGLLEGAGLVDVDRERVLDALTRRDLVAVEEALEGTGVGDAERALLLRFPALRGGRDLLDAAAQGLAAARPRRALEELGRLWDLLMAHGLEGTVHLDLGAVRDFEYYTGPIFELFSGDSGFPLGAGGRYDGLLERFGASEAATGFVIHVDRCVDAILRRAPGVAGTPILRVAWAAGAERASVRAAGWLRTASHGTARVVRDLEPTDGAPKGAAVWVPAEGEIHWWDGREWSASPAEEAVDEIVAHGSGVRV